MLRLNAWPSCGTMEDYMRWLHDVLRAGRG